MDLEMRRHFVVVHLLGFAPATEPHDWTVAFPFQTGYDTPHLSRLQSVFCH